MSLLVHSLLLLSGSLLHSEPHQSIEDVILTVDLAGFLPISSVHTSSISSHPSYRIITKLNKSLPLDKSDRSELKTRIRKDTDDWISTRVLIEGSRTKETQLDTIAFYSDIFDQAQRSDAVLYGACLSVSAFASLDTYDARYELFNEIKEMFPKDQILDRASKSIVAFVGFRHFLNPIDFMVLREAAFVRHESVHNSAHERILLASVFIMSNRSGRSPKPIPDFKTARLILDPFIKSRPADSRSIYYLAVLEENAGNSDLAVAHFKSFLSNPGDIGWMKSIAASYVEHKTFKYAGQFNHRLRFIRYAIKN